MELSHNELHCIARLLQGAAFGGNGNVFDGCAFCKYNCKNDVDPNPQYEKILKKLNIITGVNLSPTKRTIMHSKFPYKNFLENSNEEIKNYFREQFKNI